MVVVYVQQHVSPSSSWHALSSRRSAPVAACRPLRWERILHSAQSTGTLSSETYMCIVTEQSTTVHIIFLARFPVSSQLIHNHQSLQRCLIMYSAWRFGRVTENHLQASKLLAENFPQNLNVVLCKETEYQYQAVHISQHWMCQYKELTSHIMLS